RRIGEIYKGKDWRVLARGSDGGWYAVAGLASETAAVDAALAACRAKEPECSVYAIGNVRVHDLGRPAATTGHPLDLAAVPFLSSADRVTLKAYATAPAVKAL